MCHTTRDGDSFGVCHCSAAWGPRGAQLWSPNHPTQYPHGNIKARCAQEHQRHLCPNCRASPYLPSAWTLLSWVSYGQHIWGISLCCSSLAIREGDAHTGHALTISNGSSSFLSKSLLCSYLFEMGWKHIMEKKWMGTMRIIPIRNDASPPGLSLTFLLPTNLLHNLASDRCQRGCVCAWGCRSTLSEEKIKA